jgi:hypothetical protein
MIRRDVHHLHPRVGDQRVGAGGAGRCLVERGERLLGRGVDVETVGEAVAELAGDGVADGREAELAAADQSDVAHPRRAGEGQETRHRAAAAERLEECLA